MNFTIELLPNAFVVCRLDPNAPTCRSSVQVLHCSGGSSVSACCVSQVSQMKLCMVTHSFGFGMRRKNRVAPLLSGLGNIHWLCGRSGYDSLHHQRRFPRKLFLFSAHVRLNQPCEQLVGP